MNPPPAAATPGVCAQASDSNAKVPFNAAVLAMKRGNFKDGQVHYLAAIAAAARAVGDKEAIKCGEKREREKKRRQPRRTP